MNIKQHAEPMFDLNNGQVINMESMITSFDFYKKNAPAAVIPPAVAPTPPVEETGVDLDEEGKKKKVSKAGKSTLKVPLATSKNTGLRIS